MRSWLYVYLSQALPAHLKGNIVASTVTHCGPLISTFAGNPPPRSVQCSIGLNYVTVSRGRPPGAELGPNPLTASCQFPDAFVSSVAALIHYCVLRREF